MSQHLAIAQLVAKGPLSVINVPTQQPGRNEIQIEMKAVGMNPGEQKFLDSAWLEASQYPWIPGSDLAGVVSAVGEGVTKFKKGDRVVSMQMAASKVLGNRVGGLQKYAIAIQELTALIPPGVSFEEAATVPITATTSLAAFHTLSLPWPTASGRERIDEPILVWGGGSGVGRTTIAFLRLAGYRRIIATAAIKREEELKSIGAMVVVDHRDKHVVEKLINALPGYTVFEAIDAISKQGTTDSISKVMKNGGKVARTTPVPEAEAGKYQGLELAMVNCTMFHDLTGLHPDHKALGENVVWPFLQELLDIGYPFQQKLVIDISGPDRLERVAEAFELLRSESTDGRKIVVTL